MFLDIKRWMIAYLFAGTGSFGSTPYLDVHGEVDMAMR
jgi:E3 ubiquitin-protein ligase UBR1